MSILSLGLKDNNDVLKQFSMQANKQTEAAEKNKENSFALLMPDHTKNSITLKNVLCSL